MRILTAAVLPVVLNACASTPASSGLGPDVLASSSSDELQRQTQPLSNQTGQADSPQARSPADEPAARPSQPPSEELYPGSGVFVRSKPGAHPESAPRPAGDITLNFENADIREVVQTILRDIRGENYVIDPKVQGHVTLQTTRPLSQEALLPTLELLLSMNGAALVDDNGLYRIVPVQGALQTADPPRLAPPGQALPEGFQVRLVPLRYIAAQEMHKILTPLTPQGSIVQVDGARNLLMLAGTRRELTRMIETIDTFDVDWLAGMSVGMFTLEQVDIKTVAGELEAILGETSGSPLAGMFRLLPIERLNAILVITPQSAYLDEIRDWIERLDRGGEAGGERLYVYHVQNGKADHLATLLSDVFGKGDKAAVVKPGAPSLAPGLKPAQIQSRTNADQDQEKAEARVEPAAPAKPKKTGFDSGGEIGTADVRIIADEDNNALLILASPRDHEKVLAALRKLDVTPRQVLVEATIAEVTLSGALQYGLQWYFQNNSVSGDLTGTGSLNLGADTQLSDVIGSGFSYALTDSAGAVRALLTALADESKVEILSSPQVLVIDHQDAKIRVGDQQPVRVGTTTTEGGVTTENIQFKDTGVLLEVTPHVNAGGLVTMEINQEVTDVGEIDDATGQRTFLQRTINSTVAVQDAETIVLGGLIRENQSDSKGGLPGLYKLPVVGSLFGTTRESVSRTELVVLLTPRVIRDQVEARAITAEIRNKLKAVEPIRMRISR